MKITHKDNFQRAKAALKSARSPRLPQQSIQQRTDLLLPLNDSFTKESTCIFQALSLPKTCTSKKEIKFLSVFFLATLHGSFLIRANLENPNMTLKVCLFTHVHIFFHSSETSGCRHQPLDQYTNPYMSSPPRPRTHTVPAPLTLLSA